MEVTMIVTALMLKAAQRSFGKSGATGPSWRTLGVCKHCDGGIHALTISECMESAVEFQSQLLETRYLDMQTDSQLHDVYFTKIGTRCSLGLQDAHPKLSWTVDLLAHRSHSQ